MPRSERCIKGWIYYHIVEYQYLINGPERYYDKIVIIWEVRTLMEAYVNGYWALFTYHANEIEKFEESSVTEGRAGLPSLVKKNR